MLFRSLLPHTPTIAESGVPSFAFSTWTGLFAPRGVTRSVIDRLQAETAKAIDDATLRAKLHSLGGNPQASSPQALGELIRVTTARMGKVIRDAGISAE